MRIQGDNWDHMIYERLGSDGNLDSSFSHLDMVHLTVEMLGESLPTYLRENISKIQRVVSQKDYADCDLTHVIIDWLARYFKDMHDSMKYPYLSNHEEWQHLTETNANIPNSGCVYVTFQLGFPLLVPILLADLLNSPVRALIHDQNPKVASFYQSVRHNLDFAYVNYLDPYEQISFLKSGGLLVANIDTAYPGTRVESMPILNSCIRVPSGFIPLAKRAKAAICPVSLVANEGRLERHFGLPICSQKNSIFEILKSLSGFFETVIRKHPEQWLAWSSLEF